MIELGAVAESGCVGCSRTVAHTFKRQINETGTTLLGAEWRSCTYGWSCSSCSTLIPLMEDREEYDPITGEWQPRVRRSVRVPVVGEGLKVAINAHDGRSWAVKAINLSTSGILVEFHPDRTPELDSGVGLRVELRFETHRITLDAEVKRRDGRQYGIAFFPEVDDEKSFKPSPLRAIVAALEQRWLAARVK